MLAYVKTDIGLLRTTNEDSYLFEPPHLFVVADGMGGHVAGEVASKMATAIVKEYMEQYASPTANFEQLLEQAVCEANSRIYRLALSKNELSGMGTTITAIYIECDKVHWAHVGDSRLYLFNSKELNQLTNDHSLVSELVRNGSITNEEAAQHPQRNILTRAVGTGLEITVDTGSSTWLQDNILLLCTDGLTNLVSSPSIQNVLSTNENDMTTKVDMLVELAKKAGGTDNITVILVFNGE